MKTCEICLRSFADDDPGVSLDYSGCFYICEPCCTDVDEWEASVGLFHGEPINALGEATIAEIERKLAVYSATRPDLIIGSETQRRDQG